LPVLIFLAVFVPLSLLLAGRAAASGDRVFLVTRVTGVWVCLAPLVAIVHNWLPFSGGGDDEKYFAFAEPPIRSLSDALDLTRFVGAMEQPGYPWLLSSLNALTGHDLLVYKLFNLFLLILLALTWYRIGLNLDSRKFARSVMVAVLLLTPLWYYAFFLLKDMAITLLQSVFLLATIRIWSAARAAPMFAAGWSTFALLLFRTPLVLHNAAVLVGAYALKAAARRARGSRFAPLLLGALLVAFAAPVVTDTQFMMRFGIYAEHRIIGSTILESGTNVYGAGATLNRAHFPLLYLVSETAGLSPQMWVVRDSKWLRGVLAFPWIFLIVPLALLGLRWLAGAPVGVSPAGSLLARVRQSRAVATPWSAVLLFVVVSGAISWTVGDTTRWRLPDMPMITAVAVAGWYYTRPRLRQNALIAWGGGSVAAFALVHMVRG
jgi:hypothetical protein